MKKLYFLSLLLGSAIGFAQPVLTAVVDGPCTGGTPKMCEIFAKGTVDFTQFSIQNQTNAGTTWGATLDLSPLGTRTNEFVYVLNTGSLVFATPEFPSVVAGNSIEGGVLNLNGDDRIRIINTATTTVIDQFGVSDVDGTGTTWEWLDTYAKRNNGTGPDAGFVEANWTFAAVDGLDGTGTCSNATNPTLQTIVGLGGYTLSTKTFDAIAGLSLYPNPVSGNVLNITSAANLDMNVAIFDVLGKQVINTKVTNNTVNVSNLNAGVYIVKITEDGKTATRKLVVK
ncbi:T9SS type A sorting domain-containing protein [Flavobacterium ponti]|uniref:T9SS type A sorting domain-containing protein n=1 Tax=Flavobacterium ponti TaxID=665133 RepID=A0ABV9P331_9FLAO